MNPLKHLLDRLLADPTSLLDEEEAYLAQAADLGDLERRQREIEHGTLFHDRQLMFCTPQD